MLLSLIKILLFVVVVVALIFGVEFLMQHGEGLRIAVANTEFTLGPIQAVVAALLLIAAVWLLIKLLGLAAAVLHFIAGDETAISRYFARNREQRGFEALADAHTALASGEGNVAIAKAGKAQKLLGRADLTNLVRAQAAEISGDKAMATNAYRSLLEDDRTRFVGIRGLMKQKLAEGDTDRALKLAEKAFVLKPRHNETSDTLLRLQAQHENWVGARKTLTAKVKYGEIPRGLYKRRDAILALADARKRYAAGEDSAARDEAIEANRLAPGLVPAAVLASRAYVELGKPKNAAKVLKAAWSESPHPDLAPAFAAIAPQESPDARIKRFARLTGTSPSDPESRMLNAELEIAAENFPGARKALGDLPNASPDARVMTLMAAIERGEGADDSIVKAWLAKALSAPRGPQWVCDNCGHVHGEWMALCARCDAFDTLAWTRPAETDAMPNTSAAMLPLIIGTLNAKPDHAEESGIVIEEPASQPAESGIGEEADRAAPHPQAS